MLYELSLKDFDQLVKNQSGMVLVEFYAPWCRKCQSLEKVLENVCEDLYPSVRGYKMNSDDHGDFVDSLDITTLPTSVLFKNGVEVKRLFGLLGEADLKEWLNDV